MSSVPLLNSSPGLLCPPEFTQVLSRLQVIFLVKAVAEKRSENSLHEKSRANINAATGAKGTFESHF